MLGSNDPHRHQPRSLRRPSTLSAPELEPDDNGQRQTWLAPEVFSKLRALREPGESYSDLILKLVEFKAKSDR